MGIRCYYGMKDNMEHGVMIDSIMMRKKQEAEADINMNFSITSFACIIFRNLRQGHFFLVSMEYIITAAGALPCQ